MALSSKFKAVSASSTGRVRQQNPPPPSNNAFGVSDEGGPGRSILMYPMDVGNNPRFANYMLFTTYSMKPAKIRPRAVNSILVAPAINSHRVYVVKKRPVGRQKKGSKTLPYRS